MQLVLVPHGRSASLEVTHIGAFVGHDEGALELTRTPGIDPEVTGELHRAVYALGNVAEGAVGEYCGVEGCIVVVAYGHHRCQILAHQVGIVAHGLGERAEDDALLCQRLAERGLDRYGVKHRVHCGAGQHASLVQGNAEFVESGHQLGVDLLLLRRFFGGREIDDVLEVYLRDVQVGPCRHLHGQPLAVGLQAEVEEPLRLALFLRYQPYNVLVQALGDELLLHLRLKAVLVLGGAYILKYVVFLAHIVLAFCKSQTAKMRIFSYLCMANSKIPDL